MSEILKALGLTPPAIAIIIGLGGIVYLQSKIMLKKIIENDKKERGEFRATLKEIKDDIREIKEEDIKQNKGLIQVIYHQCLYESMRWKEKGYIESNAKIQFNIMWKRYKELGDGLGDDPLKIVQQLEIK